MTITQAELHRLLSYDPETGVFLRLVKSKSANPGDVAGRTNHHGYVVASVAGRVYEMHRLAWFYMTGSWPSRGMVDHKNGVRSDNRWTNLRDATRGFNAQNQRRAQSSNKSTGVIGVTLHRGKPMAQICVDGRKTYIGKFDTVEQAAEAYLDAKRRFHEGCTI